MKKIKYYKHHVSKGYFKISYKTPWFFTCEKDCSKLIFSSLHHREYPTGKTVPLNTDRKTIYLKREILDAKATPRRT